MRVAEIAGQAVGALIVGDARAYAPAVDRVELYILLLLSSRR